MDRRSCCVSDCKNKGYNSNIKFYNFPTAKSRMNQRRTWITALNKYCCFETYWTPKKHHAICSEHFIGGKKSDAVNSPSYAPTIFPSSPTTPKDIWNLGRHSRYKKRLTVDTALKLSNKIESREIAVKEEDYPTAFDNSRNNSHDKSCQAFTCDDDSFKPQQGTFVCIKYVYCERNYVDAEIQTDISGRPRIDAKVSEIRKYKDKSCGTPHKTFKDVAVGPNNPESDDSSTSRCFQGYTSISNGEELMDLTGVSIKNFNFLLKQMDFSEKIAISKENRLLFLLMKLKTGLTFSAMGVLFRVHRTTVSRIFFDCLHQLASTTSELVFWPDQETVRATTPDCFKPEYSDTRVILDCTEFRIEIPASVENRVFCYSHYKSGFTFKLLIGITPSGFICFKSDAYGGRISDTQITVESGIIDLLEHNDKVLADKGFPEFKNVIDNSGKKIMLVMPPFLKDKQEFSTEETEAAYGTAKVRIHVERIMQRLRTFRILDKIPEYLFSHIDEVIHLCCVLVNLQPPIISQVNE